MTERNYTVKTESEDTVAKLGKVSDSSVIECEDSTDSKVDPEAGQPREIGGRKGPEPTRYGDWEKNGRCIDF